MLRIPLQNCPKSGFKLTCCHGNRNSLPLPHKCTPGNCWILIILGYLYLTWHLCPHCCLKFSTQTLALHSQCWHVLAVTTNLTCGRHTGPYIQSGLTNLSHSVFYLRWLGRKTHLQPLYTLCMMHTLHSINEVKFNKHNVSQTWIEINQKLAKDRHRTVCILCVKLCVIYVYVHKHYGFANMQMISMSNRSSKVGYVNIVRLPPKQ
jgi:hypothetical protein